jgi:UDPglucose--hexose-1-phosphate uridylyltransferase
MILPNPNRESPMAETPHRRYNPLTRDWVLVSPQRTERPWLGRTEKTAAAIRPRYDPGCYLCPGNPRAAGARNPSYTGPFVFDNDFPALLPPEKEVPVPTHPLLTAESESGACRVVCFSERHDLTLPELPVPAVERVVATWTAETADLAGRAGIGYVQVFENKGEMMGASNPHPHSQIWATRHIPNEPAKELAAQTDYFQQHGSVLLADYLAEEIRRGERIVATGAHFTALVPFWAVWPFEVMIVAHRPVAALTDLTPAEQSSLADLLRRTAIRYDNLFEVSFPYSMGFHPAPNDGRAHPEWVLHAHYYPPLLRSATVRKFMVGFEMLAMPQRDLTPEAAAERLRNLPESHFRGETP